ncbi:myb-related transcription factor, partner of profilin-like [Xenopus laevis]|uniref:Myb-related transcription factor, partner of profilin-like n=1 Tax=Xenopus laevis TaxID=8355 RepID=A0A8J1LD13_XENLA|nr:myb-related transcription factor, partner of profilin-like [Xenopus laevis]
MGRRFTSEENAALVDEVIVQWDVLFGCRSHCINAARRKKIWQLVTDKVNAVGAVHRDRNTVYKRFSDLKRWMRAKFAARRAKAQKTGGGRLPSLRLQPHERRLLDIMGREVCEGLEGSHDTDWRTPPRTVPQPPDSDQDQDLDPQQPQEEGEAAESPRAPQAQEHRAPRRAQSPAVLPVVPPRRDAAEAGAAAPAAAAPIGGPPQEQPQRLGERRGQYLGLMQILIQQQRRHSLWMRRWFAHMHAAFRDGMQSMEQTLQRSIQDLVVAIRELASPNHGVLLRVQSLVLLLLPLHPLHLLSSAEEGGVEGDKVLVRGDKRKHP